MKIMFSMLAVILLLGMFFAGSAEVPSAILTKSKALYKAGKYDSTIIVIQRFIRKNGKSSETEHLVPLLVEALVRKGTFSSAHRLCSMYRLKFPKSSYLPRLWYVEGVAYAREEKYPQAIVAFSAAFNSGISEDLSSLVIANAEKICRHMAADEFSTLASSDLNLHLSEVVRYYQIDKLVAIGQFAKAANNAEAFRKQYPRSRYNADLLRIVEKAREAKKSVLQIGLLAPVSGDDEEIGKRIVQGAQLAISQLQPKTGQMVTSVVMDTRGNMINAVQKTRELLDQHSISVIIGPVLSHTATVTAAMLTNRPAVMISPTATDEGIAEISDNVFQMNVTIGVLGRKIARYAIDNLSIREFVIMAPQTQYGQILAAAFKEEVKSKNLEIIAEEYFEEGANDYRQNFQNIRKKLLLRRLERLAVERGTDFDGTVSRRDSILYADTTLAIGGLFMPAEAEDIVMLAPQVLFNRIRTQLLGSSGWYQKKVITDGKKYVENAMISTSVELDQTTKEWVDFVRLYKNRYNTEPDRIAALGYDAAALIMNAIHETGGDDPKRIAEALSKVNRHRGFSGIISFEDGRRTNGESAIYKIAAGSFVRVQ